MKKTLIKFLFRSLPLKSKRMIIRLFCLMVFSTILEAFAVASLYPYLNVIFGGISSKIIIDKLNNIKFLTFINYDNVLIIITFAMIFILVLSYSIRYLLFRTMHKVNNFLIVEIAVKFYEKIIYQDYESQSNKKSGEISNLIQSLAIGIVSNVIIPIITLVQSSLLLLLAVILLSVINISLTFITLVSIFLFYFILGRYLKKIIGVKNKIILSNSYAIQSSIIEMMSGVKDIRLVGAEKFYLKKFNYSYQQLRNNQFFLDLIVGSPKYFIECVALSTVLIVTYYLSAENRLAIGLSAAAVAIVAIQRILPSIQAIFASLSSIAAAQEQLKLYFRYFHQVRVEDGYNIGLGSINQVHSIEVKDLAFSYKSQNDKKVFNRFNAKFKRGDRVILWGDPGTGKSTLIDILSGILLPSSGVISINEIEHPDLNFPEWRSKISVVSQRPYIYDGSIIENVTLGANKIDKDLVWRVLDMVDLSNHVKSLKAGLDYRLGTSGHKFSGGQRQRLAIARAIYSAPRILILDEATNAMDVNSEANLLKKLVSMSDLDIVLIVTHAERLLKFGTQIIDLNQKT